MTGRYALIFPGQGAQKVGMGRELHDAFDAARATFSEADAALGEPLSRLVFEGPAETLTLTANTQPSILTVSVAALRALAARITLAPSFVAGHSLGEYSALVASGAMSFADAVRTTRARGTFMQQAVPAGQGAMAAVMKRSEAEVADACAQAAQGEVVSPANFNSPDQIVISGHADAVARASALLKEGGGRVIPLKVSAPFHCALMEPAATRLSQVLDALRFCDPSIPVYTNVDAAPVGTAFAAREALVRQVASPVRFAEEVSRMADDGIETFVEFGPGRVLAGLIRRILKGARVLSVSDAAGLTAALLELEG